MKLTVLTFAFVLALPTAASAQQTPLLPTPSPQPTSVNSRVHAGAVGTLVDSHSGLALTGAEVKIRRGDQVVAEALTDGQGRFSSAIGPGQYEITYKLGSSSVIRLFEVRKGMVTRVNGRLKQGDGEVIVVRERNRIRRASAKNFNRKKTPPYSDRAIEANYWARAWFVLDVDREGVVTRAKFLHRPTHDLEDIALAEVFALNFNPSINEDGKRIKTLVVWSMEWPSYWWLIDMQGTASGMPKPQNAAFSLAGVYRGPPAWASLRTSHIENQSPASGVQAGLFASNLPPPSPADVTIANGVPCRGSGPLELDSVAPVYRDCSMPDFEKMWHSEPWINRGEKASKIF